jgi:hypothetical protein
MITPYLRNGIPDFTEKHEVTANEAVALGEALVLSSGKLTKCGATTTPTFLAVEPCTAAEATAGKRIDVIRVNEQVVYETVLSVASASIAEGAKYTLSSDGLAITATTTSGVAEVVGFDGKAAGDRVLVRF